MLVMFPTLTGSSGSVVKERFCLRWRGQTPRGLAVVMTSYPGNVARSRMTRKHIKRDLYITLNHLMLLGQYTEWTQEECFLLFSHA